VVIDAAPELDVAVGGAGPRPPHANFADPSPKLVGRARQKTSFRRAATLPSAGTCDLLRAENVSLERHIETALQCCYRTKAGADCIAPP
jgi:hypothetical protein